MLQKNGHSEGAHVNVSSWTVITLWGGVVGEDGLAGIHRW